MPKGFPAEFKERAVDLVLSEGIPVAKVARDLGVSTTGLDRWVRQARVDRGLSTSTRLTPTDVQAENTVLKKENRKLREELEIVKRAAALFARDNVLPK